MLNEIWRPIIGYEGFYEVSNLGNVRSLDRTIDYTWKGTIKKRFIPGRMLRFYENTNKKFPYYMVDLNKNNEDKSFLVHRLVASAFIPNPDSYPVVNHIDCDCHNNCVDNLEWCTQSYNIHWGYVSGNRDNATAKVKETISIKVYCPELDRTFESKLEAANVLGVTTNYIDNSIQRKGVRTERTPNKLTAIDPADKEDYFKWMNAQNTLVLPLFKYQRNVLELRTGKVYTDWHELFQDYNIPEFTKSDEFFAQFGGLLPKYQCYLIDIGYRRENTLTSSERSERIQQMECKFVRKVAKTAIRCDTDGRLYRTADEADDILGFKRGCIQQCLKCSNGRYASKNLHFSRIPISELSDEECMQFAKGYLLAFSTKTSFKNKKVKR